MLNMIVAMDRKGGIGIDNQLPWKLPQDMRLFRDLTKGNTVCMGRKTWDSIPVNFRPLPQRKNLVLTTKGLASLRTNGSCDVEDTEDIVEVLALANTREVWVIGGSSTYEQFFPYLDFAVVTQILNKDYECDAFITLPQKLKLVWSKEVHNVPETKSSIDVSLSYSVYKATNNEVQPILRYQRGLISRVQQSLESWKRETENQTVKKIV